MDVLIVGSIGLDTITTPYGKLKEGLGGSATYGSVAASFFSPVRVVGVIGDDFPKEGLNMLKKRKVDTSGIQIIKGGKTFRWEGVYEAKDMNSAITMKTELNVFAEFKPVLPEKFKNTPFVFLGNIHPSLQMLVLEQMKNPKLVILDSMNLWINTTRSDLLKVLKKTDIVLLNDGEARLLTGVTNLIEAAKMVLKMGPKYVIIKKGEHGAMLVTAKSIFMVPAIPLDKVKDPTGAGDSFAGAFIGYLASKKTINEKNLKQAIAVGSVVASFDVEDFTQLGMLKINKAKIKTRVKQLQQLSAFEMPQI